MEDPYQWLEKIDDPRVLEWISARNKKLRAFLGDLAEKIFPRVLRYYEIPYIMAAYPLDKGFIVLKKNPRSHSIELYGYDGILIEKIIDSREISGDAVIRVVYPSLSGKTLAYYYSIGGQDVGELVVIDLSDKRILDRVKGSVGGMVWLSDEEYYYSRFYRREKTPDGVKPPAERIYRRIIGGGEELVFGEGLGTNHMLSIHPTYSEDKIMVTVHYGWTKSAVYGGPLRDPGEWKLLLDGGDHIVLPVD